MSNRKGLKDVMKQTIHIFTSDQVSLPALLFETKIACKGVIMLCPGLGIPKSFYVSFCEYLCKKGYHTLVFDYRGIDSLSIKSKNKTVNLRNWGMIDMPCVANWLHERYPTQKIYLIGHSIGGQVAGLMPNYQLIERFIFISSTAGYWRMFDGFFRWFVGFMFFIHIPITARLFGYMPKSLTYRGVRIAKGVALEWARWSRQKSYINAFIGNEIPKAYYQEIEKPIDWFWFADDDIATPKAVDSMMSYYTNTSINKHFIRPKLLDLPRIGHAGFFNPKKGSTLWQKVLEIINK